MKHLYKKIGLLVALVTSSTLSWGQVLQSETFDGCASPAGWTSNVVSGPAGWLFGDNTGSNIDGTCMAYFDDDDLGSGAAASNAELISPVIDLSGTTGAINLSFDYNFNTIGSSSFEVQVFDGTAWQQVFFTDVDDCGSWGCAYPTANIDVTAYTNANFQVKYIFDDGGGWEWYAGVDNYSLEEILCPDPSGGNVTNITGTSADLNWTAGGTETMWNVEWGAVGFVPGTGAELGAAPGVMATTTTATGLTAGTSYEFYVQADCGGSTSNWVGPYLFSTTCGIAPATLPLTEDFESFSGEYFGDNFIHCAPEYFWTFETENQTVGRLRVGTNAFANNGGSGAATLDVSPSGTFAENNFIMTVDMTNYDASTNDIAITFDWTEHGDEGHPNDRVFVRGSDTDIWIEAYDWYAASGTDGVWQTVNQLDISSLLLANGQNFSSTFQVRFGQDDNFPATTGTSDGFSCDNILLEEVLCPNPTGLDTAYVGMDTTSVTWLPGGSETAWNVEWGPAGFTQGTGTVINATNDTVGIGGLSPVNTYEFYVQADCGANQSNWVGPFTWTTDCGTIVPPFTEDFSSTTTPACWTETGSEAWDYSTTAGYEAGNAGDHTTGGGTNYAWIDGSSPNGPSQISSLLTPMIDVSGGPAYFSYWVYSYNTDDNGNNTLIVDVWNGSQWDTVHVIQQNFPQGWTQFGFVLNSLNPVGDMQVRFTVIENSTGSPYYNDILIDDINIDSNIPSCPEPLALQTFGVGEDSINVAWSPGYNETSWILEYGPTGFVPGNGTFMNSTNDTATINGLTAGTGYDVYVYANCGTDTSSAAGPATVYTKQSNDDACDAMPIQVDGVVRTFTNVGATTQTGEPGTTPNNTVWFKFEVPASGHVGINTCGTLFDNELEAFTITTCGDFPGYTSVGYADSNPFGCDFDDAGIEMCGLTPGDSIYMWVGSWSLDDVGTFNLKISDLGASAGQDGTFEACVSDTVNLFTALQGEETTDGVWSYPSNPSAIMNDTMIITGLMTNGNNEVVYIVDNSCFTDTATVTFNVLEGAETGTPVSPFEVCNDGVTSLFNGLQGTVDLGGTWNDDDNTGRLSGSDFDANAFPQGNYEFTYTVDNGVCPAESTTVIATVVTCTGIQENALDNFSVYPNPNNGQFMIENSGNTDDVIITVFDMSGKEVLKQQGRVAQGGKVEIDLTANESGVYFLNIQNSESTQNFRVIIE